MFENIKTVFLDFDGTVHKSIKIYAPAFKMAYKFLVENEFAEDRLWAEEEIAYWLGFSSKDMWNHFLPNLDLEIKEEASKIIAQEMMDQFRMGKAVFYDGALKVLEYLKNKGYNLVFISNCGIYYRDIAKDVLNLDIYFNEMVCSEEYEYIPKYKILEKIKDSYPKDMVIIGDRIQDIEAGKKNNIYTIGCNYGYGSENELKQADCIIEDINDIKKLL